MTEPAELSESEQIRATRLAAGGLLLAPLVTIGLWLAGGEAGYESPLFVWTHVGTLLAGILLAVGATALVYGLGARRLGIAGLAGTALAYVGVGATALWVPIAWQATVFTQTGSNSLGTFTALFSPLGSGYFSAVTFLYGLAVFGIGLGLSGTALVHRAAAGLAAFGGSVAAVWMLYTLASAMPETVTGVTIGLTMVLWTALLPLGVSLFRRSRVTTDEADVDTDTVVSGDD